MAEFKMTAGGVFHTLTKEELDHSLKAWMVDNAKGARPVRFAVQGVVAADGSLTIGGAVTPIGGTLGPAAGFHWIVNRLAVRVAGVPAGAFSVFINSTAPQSLVCDVAISANGYVSFGRPDLVLSGDDALVITAAGGASGAIAVVTGQALEVPSTLLWKAVTN